MLPERIGSTTPTQSVVGGYWTRTNDPEIDIVVADQAPVAQHVLAVGSIKWLERSPFDGRDLTALVLHRARLPGATGETPLIALSRSGCVVDGVKSYGPDELIEGWHADSPTP